MYKSAADYYSEYRVPYPDSVIQVLAQHFALDGTGQLLDVGCGTGQLAIPLSSHVESATAIDISPEMIDAAQRSADAKGVSNVSFLVRDGDDVPLDWGPYQLVTYGSSLHWLDVQNALNTTRKLLVAGGGVAICGMRSIWGGESDWEQIVMEVVREFLGEDRRTGGGTYSPPEIRFEDALVGSGFVDVVNRVEHPSIDLDLPFVIGHLYTTSYASQELLGDRRFDFEARLKEELLRLDGSGLFRWEPAVNCIFAHKPD